METITNKTLEKLKYELVRDGLVEYDVLDKAQRLAAAENINIGQALISSGVLDEATLLKFLEKKLHIPYVNLDDYSLDTKCLKYINFADARKYNVIPLFKIEDVLTVAMADPLDLFVIDKIIESAECSIEPVISSEASIIAKIDAYYNTPDTVDKIYTSSNDSGFDWRDELHSEDLSEEHIQKIIRAILKQAIIENIHELYFEQSDAGLNLIFKQQNRFENKGSIPYILVSSFVSKLKMLSNLDPSVCEVPQLGKLCFKVDEITLIASISAFPTIIGERIALKIYKPPIELSSLIKDDRQKQLLHKELEQPGIILVCGAQLSGKTHVIYSLLLEAAKFSKNIMTIESISKYDLKNVNQCELNENVGFNLDKALRFIEFQSPEMIYIEGVKSKVAFDYFSELVYNDKTV
ncbi:MAG: Flp pilus assembly complex ATPase component TadA, partial [Candidatus Gastranaerophilales bacterium]|nr:Flp pilus assembly complex ATPase component TadA [Candidatus Gastranaerophilales bacterium]